MTLKEKGEVVADYCDANDCSMNPCLLQEVCNKGTLCEQVEEAYNIICPPTEDTPKEVVYDNVNHPKHYTVGGMECIDEMVLLFGVEATKHFCKLNAWKYRRRALQKGGEEDMNKSHWYINKYKELYNAEREQHQDIF